MASGALADGKFFVCRRQSKSLPITAKCIFAIGKSQFAATVSGFRQKIPKISAVCYTLDARRHR